MPPVKDETITEINCLDISITEKSPAKNSALVDVRACNKPASKVSYQLIIIKILIYLHEFVLVVIIDRSQFLLHLNCKHQYNSS